MELEPGKLVATAFSTIAGIATLPRLMQIYLSYRACGFSIREACALTGVSERAVRHWRAQSEPFRQFDQENIGELVDKFSHKYLELQYLRNYRLVLRKDYEVLVKSVATPKALTPAENQYLLKARSHYTPEQLNLIKGLVEAGATGFDFTQLVLQFQATKVRMLNA